MVGEGKQGPTSPGVDESREGWGTPLRLVAFTGLFALVVAAASVLPYAGVGLVLLAPILLRASAMIGPRRADLVPPVAVVFTAPVLLVMPIVMMTDPVVESSWRCGTAQMSALVVLPMMAVVAGVVASGAAFVVVGFMPQIVAVIGRWGRAVVLVISLVLVVTATTRLFRYPQPEDWTSSLRVAAASSGLDTAQLGSCRPSSESDGCRLAPLAFEAAGTSRTLLLDCKTDRCTMELGDRAGIPLRSGRARDGAASPGAPVEVRVHDALGIAVIVQQGRSMIALSIATGDAVDVSLRAVAGEVAPSPLSVLAMGFALVIAAQRTRRAFGERAAVNRLTVAVDARVDDSGVVHPDDGGASFRPAGAALAEGPAVILGRPASGTYRSGADRGTWVLPGARGSHVEAHRRRAAVFDWEALAVVFAAGAPLFAAALRGLLL